MSDSPSHRAAREDAEAGCPPDVKAEIREVTDKWKDIRPGPIMPISEMHRSIERQARAWAFWRGVCWGAIFAGGAVWYIVKGLWHG